jgi:hypothetical protein
MDRDQDGHRTYKIKFLVETDDPKDGPALALNTPGLPLVGSTWHFDNDIDPWAYCRQPASVTPSYENEPNLFFDVEFTFSTKGDDKKCKEQQIEDPLLQPQEISGSFVRFQEEAVEDKDGEKILNSAHEQIRGPQNEWDNARPQVKIKQNVALLELDMVSEMVDTVNFSPMWGLPERTIKLSEFSWNRKFYGQCFVYFERSFTFDIRYRRKEGLRAITTGTGTGTNRIYQPLVQGPYETFDRYLLDEGTKVLRGHWNLAGEWELDKIGGVLPDPDNPAHFIRYQDHKSNTARVILDGKGQPYIKKLGTGTEGGKRPGSIFVQKYGESDFLLLGIPTDLTA